MEQPTPRPLSSHVTHCFLRGGRPSARVLLEHARCEAGLRFPAAWFVHLLCGGVTCPAGQVRPRRRPSLGPRLQGKGLGHRRAPPRRLSERETQSSGPCGRQTQTVWPMSLHPGGGAPPRSPHRPGCLATLPCPPARCLCPSLPDLRPWFLSLLPELRLCSPLVLQAPQLKAVSAMLWLCPSPARVLSAAP